MFKVILFFILFNGSDKEYDATARYNDSLFIYNTYQSSIDELKALKETDLQRWYDLDAANDRLTACAKVRLKKYNHKDYEPIDVFEREGMGTAYAYPKPGVIEYKTPDAFAKKNTPDYHITVYDKQTHFLSSGNCNLHVPYILKMIFDKGRLMLAEKLNPITYEKLYAESTGE